MAQHIDSVATSGIPLVNQAQFYAEMRPGDMVFGWGSSPIIDKGIEGFTGGPSHVLKVWLPWATSPWVTLEAEFGYGVRIGPFADYMAYSGDLVLCRRPLNQLQLLDELTCGISLLDYKYDSIEFASLIARRVCDRLPLIQPPNQLYCSALMQAIAMKSIPFKVPDRPWADPEQIFTEDSVKTVCGMLQGHT